MPHPVAAIVHLLIGSYKNQRSPAAHYMKNVILIEHSPLYKTAKAISCMLCCLKQWIVTNQQTLHVNENAGVCEWIAHNNTHSLRS